MALEKQFLAYSGRGHSVCRNLTLLFYFNFNYYHAKDDQLEFQLFSIHYMVYLIIIHSTEYAIYIQK